MSAVRRYIYQDDPPSWVIVEIATGKAVFETFTRKIAERVNTAKYRAVPIGEYLASLNQNKEAT